ncbi:neuraminidase-like domain-containing protein [Plantactinospora sp. GCM10030261]|uniref:neuraminidase-like domain-containing protein n=1 Tax=Plantactinospora sp. GCM10030261 TaxID=3273420 RepID=UPI003614F113
MRLHGRDLRAGLSGEDVVALQAELTRLGYAIPDTERAQRLFGVGTAQAVAAFQVSHGLVDTAVVDKNTAAVLDRALAELATTVLRLNDPPAESVVGRVPVTPAPPIAEPRPDQPRSDRPSPDEPRSDEPGPDGPRLHGPAADRPAPDRPTADRPAPDRPTADRPVPSSAEVPPRRLAGVLLTDKGVPAEGVTLRFYAPGFGGTATLLGEVVTSADGQYAMDAELPARLKRLDVRAVGAAGTEIPLAPPTDRVDLGGPVNVVIPAAQLPPPDTEFARLSASVRQHLGDAKLGQAQENDDRRDLALLREATGWDARLIAVAASAERLAATVDIDPQVGYGLLRAGLPADSVQLARISPVGIGHALRKAVEAGVVRLDDAGIAAAQARLDAFGRSTRRKLAINGTPSSYGSMLKATGLSTEQQDRFDEIFSAHTGNASALWEATARAGLPADRLKLTAQLGTLTMNSARLTESLRAEAGSTERLPTTLVAGRLYQPAAWQDRLRELAGGNERVLEAMIPPAYQAATVDERLAAYTADLAFKVRVSYPTQVLGERVRAGELPLADRNPVLAGDVATVLDRAAQTGFVPGQRPLHRFVTEHRDELFAGLSDERAEAASAHLATLNRQYQITASDEAIGVLQRHNLRSAYQVSAVPERDFVARYGDEFPSRAEAELTWRRAQQVTAVTLNLVTAAKQLDSARLLPALARPDDVVSAAQADLVKQFPTLESLFGSLDYCECEHCRSVLSPAAYLVDLLKFLDDAPALPKSPYLGLTDRRPDLPHTLLTCQNTNTALPYIDVVNEVLEFWLVNGHELNPDAAYDTGPAASEDLQAEPQNLLPAAYDLLRQARYPMTAPFDLWLATVRAFTRHFEVPFWELLEALRSSDELRPATGYGLAAVGYEQLGFSTAELAVLTAANPLPTWPDRYGYPANAPAGQWGELANARTLARRLGVTYRELLTLLRTRFVNPELGDAAGNPLILADPEGVEDCDWQDTTLRHVDGAANPVDFLLLNGFVRIWRRLDWSIEDTDQALMTFLPTDPDPRTGATLGPAIGSALLGLSRLERLGEVLNVGRAVRRDLLVLWAPLSDRRYEELFLTGTPQTRDPVFAGEPGTYLTAGVPLGEHREAVQAALRLTADEVTLILQGAGLDPATAPLTMTTVSLLYRHGLLARLLKVSVADLLVLKDLSGLDPFTPLPDGPVTDAADDHPYQQTLRFVETVRALAAAGLSVAELDFLLRHRFDPVGRHRAAAHPPLALVRSLAAVLGRISAEYAVPTDALTFTDEVLTRTLALVLDQPVVAAFLDAWTGVAALPDEVFDEHLRRRQIPGVGEVGFLGDSDRDVVFTPPTDQAADATRRGLLAAALLPYARHRLARAAVVDAVAADRDADPGLVSALLTNPALLDDPDVAGVALLDAYLASGVRGLTVTDGLVTGYLEVPASGGYRFTVAGDAGSEVRLRFDHLGEPVLAATIAADAPAAEVELRAGVAYGFTLEHTAGTVVTLLVRGQHLPTGPVTALVTYQRSTVDRLHRVHGLLGKVLYLAGELGLTEVELRHLTTHPDDFDGLDLGALPTAAAAEPPHAVQARFRQLLRLAGYARLRGELAAEPADLIDVFVTARRRVPAGADPDDVAETVLTDVTTRLATMTRRAPAIVRAAAELVGASAAVTGDQAVAADFTQEQGLGRLWRVLALANRIGVDPAALGRWATPTPDRVVAQDVRDTVKARYPQEQWRRVAQPIFDRLRQQRRDALVAQVLQRTGYQRMEQLFEHFLIDPGTEPVVLTSRLRLAISSVQLFIQRCLLNLEEDVSPSSINADHWDWMKRYRVWEANRKIFLWPENWLEPEFRDDKTHLFTELESALLESDLDQSAVEAAFFGYLRGLDEIARLDIRSIYLERKLDPATNVLHVVARTGAAPGRYYYRTWSHRSWTPWIPVTASIDGNHLAMVMWQGRIHLFWVLFLPQAEAEQQSGSTKAADVTVSTITGLKPRKKIEVQLYWSCYTPSGAGPGVWSDPVLATADEPHIQYVDATFTASKVFIWADVLASGAVSVSLLGQGAAQSFTVLSRHVPPAHSGAYRTPLEPPYLTGNDQPLTRAGQGRWRGTGPAFHVHVEGHTITAQGIAPCDITEDILGAVPGGYHLVIVPPPAKLTKSPAGTGKAGQSVNRPEDPFFFTDASNTFFVEPDWTEFSIGDADQSVVAQNPIWREFDKPEYWAAQPVAAAFPDPLDGPVRPDVVLGRTPIARPVDVLTRDEAVVVFDGKPIGADGLLTDPGRLFRTGPHGSVVRNQATNPTPRS